MGGFLYIPIYKCKLARWLSECSKWQVTANGPAPSINGLVRPLPDRLVLMSLHFYWLASGIKFDHDYLSLLFPLQHKKLVHCHECNIFILIGMFEGLY